VARGAGAGAQAGTGGGDPNAGPGPAEYRSLMARWGGGIRAAIERSLRPAGGPGGTTRLRLTVTADGRLAGAAIAASSGHAALDRAALAAVRAARYPPAPRGLPPGSYTFTLPLTQR
jgi:protein TonB